MTSQTFFETITNHYDEDEVNPKRNQEGKDKEIITETEKSKGKGKGK
jgi:hypothetical protein